MNMNRNRGFSLIEILITIVILMVGLLGLAGLQGRALTSQMESYQRSQALILLKDMGDRIGANRSNAAAYITNASGVTPVPRGTGYNGSSLQDCSGMSGSNLDLCEWHNALLGSAEVQSGVGNVGAMVGARGCVYQFTAPASGVAARYMVAVAWQGLNRTKAPEIDCGEDAYGNDALRRVVTLPITIADLGD